MDQGRPAYQADGLVCLSRISHVNDIFRYDAEVARSINQLIIDPAMSRELPPYGSHSILAILNQF